MSAPRHTFRITALTLMIAGLAAASTPALARGLGGAPSMSSFNIGPRMNNSLPAVQKGIGDPNTKSIRDPELKGASKGFTGGVKIGKTACDKTQAAGCSNNLGPQPHLKKVVGKGKSGETFLPYIEQKAFGSDGKSNPGATNAAGGGAWNPAGLGGPDTKSLGGPDTKSLGGPDTKKSLGGPDTKIGTTGLGGPDTK